MALHRLAEQPVYLHRRWVCALYYALALVSCVFTVSNRSLKDNSSSADTRDRTLTKVYLKPAKMATSYLILYSALTLCLIPSWLFAQTNISTATTTQLDTMPGNTHMNKGNGQSIIFTPALKRRMVHAVEINGKLKIDGRLDEADWLRAQPIRQFVQVDPQQGEAPTFDTDVRVLFNRNFLYVAAFNRDSLGRRALRTPDFKRDFSRLSHDLFAMVIDGFNDRRNAMTFGTNPYGTQRDLLSFDDLLHDESWDGLWKVRTSRTDSGWVAEMQIPWQTLRYARSADTVQTWGINFVRTRRFSNELSAWSLFPRAFTSSRMEYAGLVAGLKPPPPRPNIRIQPYALVAADRYKGTEVGYGEDANLKIGGDVKWAINPNTVLDLTFNTDFAQADVDRQVNNLTRFSVLFPERRAFFLENASLFGAGLSGNSFEGGNMTIRPFFSRTVGLATLSGGASAPVPIDAGARLVYRSIKRNYGGMLIRQRGIMGSPTTYFAVGRYVENVGKQNRIGGLFTIKNTHGLSTDSVQIPARQNGTVAIDGFFRLSQALAYNAMLIGSMTSDSPIRHTATSGSNAGVAGYSQFLYRSNQLVAYLTQTIVTQKFNPEMGFVSRSNVVSHSFGGFFIDRRKWLPEWVRSFEPGLFAEVYHKATTGRWQEAQVNINPVFLGFQNGGNVSLFINPTFQRLEDGDYRPLNLAIPSGLYRYVRYSAELNTDPSKKVSFQFRGETGRYYDGQLTYGRSSLILAPIPHAAFTLNAEVNNFREVGGYSGVIALYSVESRLAVNPRLQLISFFQRNTFTDRNVWNVRLSWEFQPLSFLYVVYNRGAYAGSARDTNSNLFERQQEQHLIGKLSYLKQF